MSDVPLSRTEPTPSTQARSDDGVTSWGRREVLKTHQFLQLPPQDRHDRSPCLQRAVSEQSMHDHRAPRSAPVIEGADRDLVDLALPVDAALAR